MVSVCGVPRPSVCPEERWVAGRRCARRRRAPKGGGVVRPRVLFVYQLPAPFILTDRDLLRKFADVKEFRWFGRPHPARLLTRWMLRNRAAFDIVFIWFGDAHASVATR